MPGRAQAGVISMPDQHPQPTNSPTPTAPDEPLIPLARARPGETVELFACRGGMGLQRRLAEIGLGIGSRFVVERIGHGPCVIASKGARLILGHGMVGRLLIRRAKSGET